MDETWEITPSGAIIAGARWLRLDDAAATSGVPRATLYRWARQGRVKSIKDYDDRDGREKWFVLDVDLERKIGRKLRPYGGPLAVELEDIADQLSAEVILIEATVSEGQRDHMTQLKYLAQWMSDLSRRVALKERTP
jgi:hypothetical protein